MKALTVVIIGRGGFLFEQGGGMTKEEKSRYSERDAFSW
jgi:hypothetical protein